MFALSKTNTLVLRIVQAVLAVIVLGCAAAGLKWSTGGYCIITCFSGFTYTSQVMSFLIAAAVLSLLLCGLYITMMFVPSLCKSYGGGVTPTRNFTIAMLTLDAVWMIFWFAAAISSAVDASGTGISTWAAASAFSWFSWVAWVASLVLDIMHLVKLLRGGKGAAPATAKTADVEVGKPAAPPAPVSPVTAVPPAASPAPAAAYPQV